MSVNDIIISSQVSNINLSKQLPFYGKTIKPRIEEFTNAKLLSELPFFEKPIKAKIKQLSTKELLKYYDLDPCHFFSAPGLSWDAMSKMTGVTLEKISDPDKYMFFEQGMRGGVTYINKR